MFFMAASRSAATTMQPSGAVGGWTANADGAARRARRKPRPGVHTGRTWRTVMPSRLMTDLQLHLPFPRAAARDSWAVFSPCRRYRYRLVRVWDSTQPRLGWVMLNSSDANEHRDDPTVRRTIGFARAWAMAASTSQTCMGSCRKLLPHCMIRTTRSGLTTMRTLPRFAPTMTSP
ncbi:hypothetical protein I552_0484 [Mycobacterium xenopi 3993]|nr:hypothetical protein I552_0484 [Mycobacterium xenopi 3993]